MAHQIKKISRRQYDQQDHHISFIIRSVNLVEKLVANKYSRSCTTGKSYRAQNIEETANCLVASQQMIDVKRMSVRQCASGCDAFLEKLLYEPNMNLARRYQTGSRSSRKRSHHRCNRSFGYTASNANLIKLENVNFNFYSRS